MKTILTAAASLALAGTAMAGTTGYSKSVSKGPVPPPPPPAGCQCFGPGETDLDFFASYAVSGGDDTEGWGGGVRLSSFFSTYFGLAVTYNVLGDAPIHDVSASFVARYPIVDACLAPYVYAGPGGYFNSHNEFTGHVGFGLDIRLWECSGLFVDYRHTFADQEDYGIVSAGYRWNF